MNKEQLILRAKELGIYDPEIHKTNDSLKEAISVAETRLALVSQANKLGVTFTAETSNEELTVLIETAEDWNQLVIRAEALQITGVAGLSKDELTLVIFAAENTKLIDQVNEEKTKVVALAGALGIDPNLSAADLSAAAQTAIEALTPAAVVVSEAKKPQAEGKTDKTFESSNGKTYGFTPKAPGSFRFAGVLRTQKEWLKDKDAMELMVSGNVTYLQISKK